MKSFIVALAALAVAPAFAQDAPPAPPRGEGMMMRADTDGDGVITRAEALAQAGQRFDRMDLNHDGRLTRDELQQIGQRMRGMRGGDMPPPPADAPTPRR